jgi:hypothetical protein
VPAETVLAFPVTTALSVPAILPVVHAPALEAH